MNRFGEYRKSGWWRSLFALAAFCIALPSLQASDDIPSVPARFVERAARAYSEAKSELAKQPESPEAILNFGRTAFDHGEFARNDRERESIATEAVSTLEHFLESHADSAPGHYYLGMNLGQVARTKSVGALRIVKRMEREFSRAAELDQNLDHAGPDRNLGLLYLEAPGWPTSIGNRSKAVDHLAKALKIAPRYPENHLNRVEAFLKWRDYSRAKEALEECQKILSEAKKELSGEAWEPSWYDWNRRLEEVRSKLEDNGFRPHK
jgi:tetratricopeptide (TPR) repeat protein